jgi:hypothetical protein
MTEGITELVLEICRRKKLMIFVDSLLLNGDDGRGHDIPRSVRSWKMTLRLVHVHMNWVRQIGFCYDVVKEDRSGGGVYLLETQFSFLFKG